MQELSNRRSTYSAPFDTPLTESRHTCCVSFLAMMCTPHRATENNPTCPHKPTKTCLDQCNVVMWCIQTWESLLVGLGNKFMQVPSYPSGGVGLPWQQPTGSEEGRIPGRLGMVLGGPTIGAGCRLMGFGPLMSAQLKQPVQRGNRQVRAVRNVQAQTPHTIWMEALL